MKQKSLRNTFYLFTALVLLSIFWSVLSKVSTNMNGNYLFVTLTTFSSWLLLAIKQRKNEITASRTQELVLYLLSFPAISLATLFVLKLSGHAVKFYPFMNIGGAMLAACSIWLLLRLNETMEFSFGRKIIVHSKLGEKEFQIIAQSIKHTRLENQIILKRSTDLESLKKNVDLFIVANTTNVDEEIMAAHMNGVRIESYDQFITGLHGRINPSQVYSADFFTMNQLSAFVMMYQSAKEMLEPFIAGIMLLVLSPIMLFIAALIKATSNGPAIFAQVRTGHNGKPFTLYKFRSMNIDAEKDGPQWSSTNDNRITFLGKFLRASHMDELPQLINVIKGDMSFVGPRPELPAFYESLKKDIPHFHLRTLIKPGITGWAQIKGGYANSVESSKTKLELDLYYMLNVSPLIDFQIVLDTLTGNKTRVEANVFEKGLTYEVVTTNDNQ